jgi:hypothetical protein
MIRSMAEGDPAMIVRCVHLYYYLLFLPPLFLNPLLSAIKGYLQKDKNSYGGPGAHARVAPEELNSWQQGVDDSLAAAAAEADAELSGAENSTMSQSL